MARRPKWRASADPTTELEIELTQLGIVARMLVETEAELDPQAADYLGERVLEHVGRATRAFYAMCAQNAPPTPPSPLPPQLTAREKAEVLELLQRRL